MINAFIVTKNNENTIKFSLSSLGFAENIYVIDQFSSDATLEICKSNSKCICFRSYDSKEVILNEYVKDNMNQWNLYLNPWEEVVREDLDFLRTIDNKQISISMLDQKTITKEVRIWSKQSKVIFTNPFFTKIEDFGSIQSGFVFRKNCQEIYDNFRLIKWIEANPFKKEPLYIYCMNLLMKGETNEFLEQAKIYTSLFNDLSVSTSMMRFYMAFAFLVLKKDAKRSSQLINLCLVANPTMAEFWCLQGDIYYHCLNDYKKAKNFYNDAIILGSKRLKTDKWPLDLVKYKEYPTKMINSCNNLSINS